MSEFLKNKYFFNEKSSSYNLIPFSKENVLVLPEFLKNKYFVKENVLVLPDFLKNK
jgi:hypothetical protein